MHYKNTPPADVDNEAPGSPLNLSATVDFTTVNLTWLESQDNVAVTAYNVYQDGVVIATTENNAISVTDLQPLTAFVFGVSAIDEAGNESSISTLEVTSGQDETPDTTPPSVPGNLSGNAGFSSVLLSWEASVDDRKLAGYVVSIDGVYFDSLDENTTTVFIGNLDSETPSF